MSVRRPRVEVDLRLFFQGEEPGHARKSLVVLHETVSHNRPGTGDITGVAAFMDRTGLEIHGIIDMEGNSAWCHDPTAIYDHAASGSGRVNTRSIGFELVSEVPFERDPAKRRKMWDPKGPRRRQLDEVAQWIAWLHLEGHVPLRFSDASRPGVTTHWSVTRTYLGGNGHWDCWPMHMGGHFPALYVVNRARQLVRDGEGV